MITRRGSRIPPRRVTPREPDAPSPAHHRTSDYVREIQVNEGTLGNWVNKYRVEHADDEPPLSVSDRARLRELERENRELRMKAEFLGKAAAFFAQEYR
jgi:transposase